MVFNIELKDVDAVNRFCSTASKFDEDIDVRYRHYVLDAKSVLGIQSIPKNEDLQVYVHDMRLNNGMPERVLDAFSEFIKK